MKLNEFFKKVVVFWGMLAVITLGSRALFSEETKDTKEKTGKLIPVATSRKEDAEVEKVIQTLNDTLAENRKLSGEVVKIETELEKEKARNNILAAQIKELQNDLKDAGNVIKERNREIDKERESLKIEQEKMAEERKKTDELKIDAENKVRAIEEENARMKDVLESAILEKERDEIRALLKTSKEDNERAVQALAESKKETERLRSELSSQYYDLGNFFVEKKSYNEAIHKYKKALDINPNDAWAHHNLAIIYDFYVADNQKAIYHYKEYLNLKPVDEEAGKIKERVMEMELGKMVTPPMPVKMDFDQIQKDTKNVK